MTHMPDHQNTFENHSDEKEHDDAGDAKATSEYDAVNEMSRSESRDPRCKAQSALDVLFDMLRDMPTLQTNPCDAISCRPGALPDY